MTGVTSSRLLYITAKRYIIVNLPNRIVWLFLHVFIRQYFSYMSNKCIFYCFVYSGILLDSMHEHFETIMNIWNTKYITNARSLICITHKNLSHYLLKLLRILFRKWFIITTQHFSHQTFHVIRCEWSFQCHYFIQ